MDIKFTSIKENDFESVKYLLSQLTNVGDITKENYISYYSSNIYNNDNYFIYLMKVNDNIVGMGSIIIEYKIIHNFGKVAHIEDIVIDKKYRGKGYGKMMINHLIKIAKQFKCYKIILSCSDENKNFYKKNGFINECNTMVKRL